MRDELVKDLREKAEFLASAEPLGIKNAFAETMKQAADSIEEMSAVVESYRHRMAYVPQPPKEE